MNIDNDVMVSQAVVRLVTDGALAARWSSNGRKLAERCAGENVRPQWEQLFRELLGDGVG